MSIALNKIAVTMSLICMAFSTSTAYSQSTIDESAAAQINQCAFASISDNYYKCRGESDGHALLCLVEKKRTGKFVSSGCGYSLANQSPTCALYESACKSSVNYPDTNYPALPKRYLGVTGTVPTVNVIQHEVVCPLSHRVAGLIVRWGRRTDLGIAAIEAVEIKCTDGKWYSSTRIDYGQISQSFMCNAGQLLSAMDVWSSSRVHAFEAKCTDAALTIPRGVDESSYHKVSDLLGTYNPLITGLEPKHRECNYRAQEFAKGFRFWTTDESDISQRDLTGLAMICSGG